MKYRMSRMYVPVSAVAESDPELQTLPGERVAHVFGAPEQEGNSFYLRILLERDDDGDFISK